MSDAAGELADRLHLLALSERFLDLEPIGDLGVERGCLVCRGSPEFKRGHHQIGEGEEQPGLRLGQPFRARFHIERADGADREAIPGSQQGARIEA